MPWKPKQHTPHQRTREPRSHAKTTTERGYGWDWQKFRKRFLQQHPLCEDCLNPDPLATPNAFEQPQSRVTPATEVHHVAKIKHAPDKRLDGENLMALCDFHHNKRTAKGE